MLPTWYTFLYVYITWYLFIILNVKPTDISHWSLILSVTIPYMCWSSPLTTKIYFISHICIVLGFFSFQMFFLHLSPSNNATNSFCSLYPPKFVHKSYAQIYLKRMYKIINKEKLILLFLLNRSIIRLKTNQYQNLVTKFKLYLFR